MKFLELFDSRDKKKRLSHVKNLIALACSDGSLDKPEMDLIFQIGINAGLKIDELERLIKRPDSVDFFPPDNYRERIEQLYDMVLVMMVDGELHDNEIVVCKLIAVKLGFKHQIIDKMVLDIIEFIVKGIAAEVALDHLMRNVD